MIRYSFSAPPQSQLSEKYPDTAEGWASFKQNLAVSLPPSFILTVEADGLADTQVKNLVALVQKAAHHIFRVGCYNRTVSPQATLWRLQEGERTLAEAVELSRTRLPHGISIFLAPRPPTTLGSPQAYDLAIRFECIKPRPNNDLCKAFTRRMVNLFAWPFGVQTALRLTSPSPLKWATFEEITKYRRIGINGRERN